MKPTELGKIKEKGMIQSVNYITKGLKIVMNIANYQILKKISWIKNSSL